MVQRLCALWFTLSGITGTLFLAALQLLVLYTHLLNLSPCEAAPLHVPSLGLHSSSWPSALLSRVLLRGRSLQDLTHTAALLAATSFTAATTIYTVPSLHGTRVPTSLAFSSSYGLCLGCTYTLMHLSRCCNVLAYPTIHRHRAYQLRQRLPGCLLAGARVALTALLVALALGHRCPGGVAGLVTHWAAAALAAAGWLLGSAALEVVMTEPLRLERGAAWREPASACMELLAGGQGCMQELALQELCALAEGQTPSAFSARAAVFADDTGRTGWSPMAGFLLAEARDWAVAASAAAAPPSTVAPTTGRAPPRQWNAVPLSGALGLRSVSRAADLAAWTVRAKYQRLAFCVRALSALAAASRGQDRYGVVLMADPVLGDVVVGLLAVVIAAQQYAKAATLQASRPSALGSALRRLVELAGQPAHVSLQQGDGCAAAVEDLTRGCATRLVLAFGPSLRTALKTAKLKPAAGTSTELTALLSSLLAFE